tara:strand:+ start:111523 stop:112005 length:483 start_codon:yes stop_codon:yes gene_type:complete
MLNLFKKTFFNVYTSLILIWYLLFLCIDFHNTLPQEKVLIITTMTVWVACFFNAHYMFAKIITPHTQMKYDHDSGYGVCKIYALAEELKALNPITTLFFIITAIAGIVGPCSYFFGNVSNLSSFIIALVTTPFILNSFLCIACIARLYKYRIQIRREFKR